MSAVIRLRRLRRVGADPTDPICRSHGARRPQILDKTTVWRAAWRQNANCALPFVCPFWPGSDASRAGARSPGRHLGSISDRHSDGRSALSVPPEVALIRSPFPFANDEEPFKLSVAPGTNHPLGRAAGQSFLSVRMIRISVLILVPCI